MRMITGELLNRRNGPDGWRGRWPDWPGPVTLTNGQTGDVLGSKPDQRLDGAANHDSEALTGDGGGDGHAVLAE